MRHNFSKKVKDAALARSGGRCEAVGPRYGLPEGVRCNADLNQTGVEYDHWPLGAHAEGSDTLENCNATCPRCNQFAANKFDKTREAKIKRVRKKHGLDPPSTRKKAKIKGRGFQAGHRPLKSRNTFQRRKREWQP
jgi:hypothetical protein